MIDLFIVFNAI